MRLGKLRALLAGVRVSSTLIYITILAVTIIAIVVIIWQYTLIETHSSVVEAICSIVSASITFTLVYITSRHMNESRKLRLKPLYSQLVNMLVLPLISTVDRNWKRKNIRESFIISYGLPRHKLRSETLIQVRGSELERAVLWDIFMRVCSDVTKVIAEHDDIIEQLREAKRRLREKLETNMEFRKMVKRTLEEHFTSYGLKSSPEGFIDKVIYSFIEGGELEFGYEHEYWEGHRSQLQEAIRRLRMKDKSIEELVMTIERLEEKLTGLPNKQEIVNRLRDLAKRYSEEYGITLQRPEWLLCVY